MANVFNKIKSVLRRFLSETENWEDLGVTQDPPVESIDEKGIKYTQYGLTLAGCENDNIQFYDETFDEIKNMSRILQDKGSSFKDSIEIPFEDCLDDIYLDQIYEVAANIAANAEEYIVSQPVWNTLKKMKADPDMDDDEAYDAVFYEGDPSLHTTIEDFFVGSEECSIHPDYDYFRSKYADRLGLNGKPKGEGNSK